MGNYCFCDRCPTSHHRNTVIILIVITKISQNMIAAGKREIELELFLRMRKKSLVWVTKQGEKIPLANLSNSHLVNIYNMLNRLEELQEEQDEIMDHLGDMDPLEYYD